jgi:hypothetical protein
VIVMWLVNVLRRRLFRAIEGGQIRY